MPNRVSSRLLLLGTGLLQLCAGHDKLQPANRAASEPFLAAKKGVTNLPTAHVASAPIFSSSLVSLNVLRLAVACRSNNCIDTRALQHALTQKCIAGGACSVC